MSSYPRVFQYPISRLSGFSRQKYRIMGPAANVSYAANSQLVLDLPKGILDLSTLTLHGQITTTATGGTSPSVRPPFAEALIESLSIEAGGIAVQNISSYGQLFSILRDWQLFDKQAQRQVLNLDPPTNTALGDNDLKTNTPFAIWNWLGFLGSNKILDTTLLPPVKIYIRFAPNACLSTKGTPTGISYTLSNVYFCCDIVDIADGVYSNMINERLRSAPIELPFQNWTTVMGGSGAITSSTKFSTSAHCLEGVYGTVLDTAYANVPSANNTTTGLPLYYTRLGTNVTSAQFYINSVPFPSIPLDTSMGEDFAATAHALNASQDTVGQTNPQMNSLTNWKNNFWMVAQSFTYDADGNESRLCGLDGRGNVIMGNLDLKGSGSGIPLIFLKHQSVLRVGSSHMIELVL